MFRVFKFLDEKDDSVEFAHDSVDEVVEVIVADCRDFIDGFFFAMSIIIYYVDLMFYFYNSTLKYLTNQD